MFFDVVGSLGAMSECRPGMESYAVVVRQACKKYGDIEVLRNLNMSVKRGTIYGLLGASGCGKTTLLSCVVGRRQLDSGDVRVLGVAPGTIDSGVPGWRIGYMPQELSLYDRFTIKENVVYFGTIFNMTTEEIENRLTFLERLLELPDRDTVVKNLSGGQQRRVSFLVSMLHDAELLLLDEPTVGMDPILRQVIWEYLVDIARTTNKTIILTTHYIDETRKADTVGLIRNGYLMDETSPDTLLQKYNCESLEEVFLSLSSKQEKNLLSTLSAEVHSDEGGPCSYELEDVAKESFDICEGDSSTVSRKRCLFPLISTSRIRALLYKNVLSIWRDVMLMLFFFTQSVGSVAAIYCAFASNPSQLPLAIVNHDVTSPSPTCRDLLPLGGCNLTDLSCHFLSHITGPVLKKEFYSSTEEAQMMVARGKAWGAMYFSHNFTHSLEERIRLDSFDARDDMLEHSSIQTWLDMSNQVISSAVKDELYSKYKAFSRQILTACDMNPKFGQLPINVFEPVYGTMKVSFLDTTTPGLLLTLAFLLGTTLSVWTIVHERVEGLLTRNIISGVTTLEIMVAYFLCMFVLICVQAVLLMSTAFLVFRIYNIGDLMLVTIFLMAQGTCGILYGFVISASCNNETTAMHISTGSMYPLLFFCGILWPVEALNTFLYYLSKLMPLTLPTKAMQWIIVRGWTMYNMEVLVGFLAIFLWMAVLLIACTIILRHNKL